MRRRPPPRLGPRLLHRRLGALHGGRHGIALPGAGRRSPRRWHDCQRHGARLAVRRFLPARRGARRQGPRAGRRGPVDGDTHGAVHVGHERQVRRRLRHQRPLRDQVCPQVHAACPLHLRQARRLHRHAPHAVAPRRIRRAKIHHRRRRRPQHAALVAEHARRRLVPAARARRRQDVDDGRGRPALRFRPVAPARRRPAPARRVFRRRGRPGDGLLPRQGRHGARKNRRRHERDRLREVRSQSSRRLGHARREARAADVRGATVVPRPGALLLQPRQHARGERQD
mmetsp:Transcript_17549/g.54831  ORF Transcript_17549/g.54831 Transcript_17549/m.54831 type:complete len:285 (-) Transcript_17549:1721-2575(-)